MRNPIPFLIVYGLLTIHFAAKAAVRWNAHHNGAAWTYTLLAAVGTATFVYRMRAYMKSRRKPA